MRFGVSAEDAMAMMRAADQGRRHLSVAINNPPE
jgi:hypothetical protein